MEDSDLRKHRQFLLIPKTLEFEKHNDIEVVSSRVSDEFKAKEAVFDLINKDHGKN